MAASHLLLLACVPLALVSSSDQDDLPDCVCEKQWFHEELKCGKGGGKHMYNKCPTLEELHDCEDTPKQSWCVTTQAHCKQQEGNEMVNQSWAFCEPETAQGVLPTCECQTSWTHDETDSTCTKGAAKMYGCPSLNKLASCEVDAAKGAEYYGNMSWCKTTYERCQEQVNHPETVDGETVTVEMVGEGWAMCDADSGYANLPDCECKESWAGDSTCAGGDGGSGNPFSSCTHWDDYLKQCKYPVQGLHQQDFCEVKFSPCKQQSETATATGAKDAVTDMTKYAYCDVATEEPEYPQCRCKQKWSNTDGDCKYAPISMSGCPSVGELRKCDSDVQNDGAYCDTTYTDCDEQGYEQDEDGGGWAYCDPKTQEAEYPTCVCMNDWQWTADEANAAACSKPRMRGCPSLEELQRCEPDAKEANLWCDTKDMYCRGQEGTEAIGEGWVYCNPESQWARATDGKSSVGAAVGITFVLTVIFCTMLFIAFLYAYKEYLNHHKKGYSQELLQS